MLTADDIEVLTISCCGGPRGSDLETGRACGHTDRWYEPTARGEVAVECAMHIEKRSGVEYLVGVTGEPNDCEEYSPEDDLICTHHFDGHHISGGSYAPDGAIEIEARWPIGAMIAEVKP